MLSTKGTSKGTCVYKDARLWGIQGKTAVDRLVEIFTDYGLQNKRVAMEYGHRTRLFMPACDWDELKLRLLRSDPSLQGTSTGRMESSASSQDPPS